MAGKKGYDVLRQDVKDGTLQKVYIFYGEETYLRQTYLTKLRQLLVPEGFAEFNHHRLSGKGLSVQDLQEAVEAMPMMAPSTLVEVADMDIFKLDEAGRDQLIALLEDFPDYCTLVFDYDAIPYKRDGKYKKLCAAIDGDSEVRGLKLSNGAARNRLTAYEETVLI